MHGYFNPHLHAKTLVFEKTQRSKIVLPNIGGDSGEATRLRLLNGPLHEPLPYPLGAMAGMNGDAVHQETLPILSLVNRLQDAHSIRGEKVLLLIAQPLGRKGIDHADDDTLVHGYETIAPRKPA